MMRAAVASTLFLGANAMVDGSLRGSLSASESLQPEVVARTLAKIEQEWRLQAVEFQGCKGSCTEPADAFKKSCLTVAQAVLKASGGDRKIVNEYMTNVCSQSELSGWRQDRCQLLGKAIETQGDETSVCKDMWTRVVAAETPREDEAKAADADSAKDASTSAAPALDLAAEKALAKKNLVEFTAKATADVKKAETDTADADKEAEEARALLARAQVLKEATAPKNVTTPAKKSKGHAFMQLEESLQPEVVAKLLAKIEENWKSQAVEFNACNVTHSAADMCKKPVAAFRKSCLTVTKSVLRATLGDKKTVTDYMVIACRQDALQAGWKHERCELLGNSIAGAMDKPMTDATLVDVCQGLWSRVTTEEGQAAPKIVAAPNATVAAVAVVTAPNATEDEKALGKQEVAAQAKKAGNATSSADSEQATADKEEADAESLVAKAKLSLAAGKNKTVKK